MMNWTIKLRSAFLEFKLWCRVLWAASISLWAGSITPVGRLYATRISADGSRTNLGLISTKVVTTVGVEFIVDAFQNIVELELMRQHGSGTGSTAENIADTALVTEVESRTSGTIAEGASGNIYQTVGTVAYTAARAIVEHGIFSAATAGVLLDRSVFAAINVTSGDSIQFTYEITFPAGS